MWSNPLGATDTVRALQTAGTDDEKSTLRCSHHNPAALCREWLGKTNGEKAHKLLHNHYHTKPVYKK